MENGRGTLFIVATPIGTIGDIGDRARDVLAEVDLILAEDTRRVRKLLGHAGIPSGRRLRSLHQHNEHRRTEEVMAALEEGLSAALVSDAGTPVLSDPGFPLVRAARLAGCSIASVPGPSVFTAALAASGQPALPAVLLGFLPPRRAARRRRLLELAAWPHTAVVLLSPHRLADELADLAEALGERRPATLLAEISKRHERALMADLGSLAGSDEAAGPRGEYVLVVGPTPIPEGDGEGVTSAEVGAAYRRATGHGLDRREALRAVADELGLRRREVFDLLLEDGADDA